MKTSMTHPILVGFVENAAHGLPGKLGLTLAPGKKIHGQWNRDLDCDLERLREHLRVDVLVSLLEPQEYDLLDLAALPARAVAHGLERLSLPIPDGSVPESLSSVRALVGAIVAALTAGRTVVIHCRGGLGRSGLLAACCLVARGGEPSDAIAAVRRARPGAVENEVQAAFVARFADAVHGNDGATEGGTSLRGSQRSTTPDTCSRFRACLLGGALGDALGGPIEFLTSSAIERLHGVTPPDLLAVEPSGFALVTDDTQMTLFTAEGVLRARSAISCPEPRSRDHGPSDPQAILLNAYFRWYFTQTGEWKARFERGFLVEERRLHARRAPGNTCLGSLAKARYEGPLPSVERPPNQSKGCGAVMRAAPIGLGVDTRERAFDLGRDAGLLTHGHPSGYLSSAVLSSLVWDLSRGGLPLPALDAALTLLVRERGHEELRAVIERAVRLAKRGAPDRAAIESLGGGWVGEEALAIALLCALTADRSVAGIRAALWRSVAHSGDSDSTGSITGNLLGAMVGMEGLDARWLEQLEMRALIDSIAVDLFRATVEKRPIDRSRYPPS